MKPKFKICINIPIIMNLIKRFNRSGSLAFILPVFLLFFSSTSNFDYVEASIGDLSSANTPAIEDCIAVIQSLPNVTPQVFISTCYAFIPDIIAVAISIFGEDIRNIIDGVLPFDG